MLFSLSDLPVWLPIILTFVFGAAIGSFLNVLIWRLPREESIQGRSHCPNCNHKLVWHDLIPVVSILAQRARCKYCKKPISLRYPLIEVLVGFLFALTMWFFPIVDLSSAILFAKVAVVIAICVTVFIIDLEHFLILDRIVFPGWVLMLIFAIILGLLTGGFSNLTSSLLGALVAFVPFWILWYGSKLFGGSTGKWMGFGDVKFVVFMGLALGMPGVVIALFLSFTIGALVGVGLIMVGQKQFSSKLPFGTFLSVATVIAIFWGSQLWNIYWNLFSLS